MLCSRHHPDVIFARSKLLKPYKVQWTFMKYLLNTTDYYLNTKNLVVVTTITLYYKLIIPNQNLKPLKMTEVHTYIKAANICDF